MIERILFNFELILVDFFTAYGLTTILFLILSIFIKKHFLKKADDHSNRFISFIGIVYLIVWIIATIVELYMREEQGKNDLLHRMFGKYWFGFGFSPYYGFQLRSFYDLKQSGKIFFGD